MKIFLAGVSGGCEYIVRDINEGKKFNDKELAVKPGGKVITRYYDVLKKEATLVKDWKPFVLHSFFYCRKSQPDRSCYGDYLLDSGAFTYIDNLHLEHPDWESYAIELGEYVKNNKIDKYFELDIDSLVGYDEVKRLRKIIESRANVLPIPVWHDNRGKDEFIRMCEEYPYVALGGLVSGKTSKSAGFQWYKDNFRWFVDTAHEHNCKIHALGITTPSIISKIPFDSVDSSSWASGGAFGHLYYFDGSKMKQIKVPKGKWFRDPQEARTFNFIQWEKFQRYALKNY